MSVPAPVFVSAVVPAPFCITPVKLPAPILKVDAPVELSRLPAPFSVPSCTLTPAAWSVCPLLTD